MFLAKRWHRLCRDILSRILALGFAWRGGTFDPLPHDILRQALAALANLS